MSEAFVIFQYIQYHVTIGHNDLNIACIYVHRATNSSMWLFGNHEQLIVSLTGGTVHVRCVPDADTSQHIPASK